MKTMSDFNKWLFSNNGKPVAYRQKLKGLMNLNFTQLAPVSSNSTWFVWSEEKSPEETSPDEKIMIV